MGNRAFEKKHGFAPAPVAHLEGYFEAFKTRVEAKLTCKLCGTLINMRFRGNPDTMTPAGLKDWIIRRATKKHQCPAILDILKAKPHKHFADLIRGQDKLKDIEHRMGKA